MDEEEIEREYHHYSARMNAMRQLPRRNEGAASFEKARKKDRNVSFDDQLHRLHGTSSTLSDESVPVAVTTSLDANDSIAVLYEDMHAPAQPHALSYSKHAAATDLSSGTLTLQETSQRSLAGMIRAAPQESSGKRSNPSGKTKYPAPRPHVAGRNLAMDARNADDSEAVLMRVGDATTTHDGSSSGFGEITPDDTHDDNSDGSYVSRNQQLIDYYDASESGDESLPLLNQKKNSNNPPKSDIDALKPLSGTSPKPPLTVSSSSTSSSSPSVSPCVQVLKRPRRARRHCASMLEANVSIGLQPPPIVDDDGFRGVNQDGVGDAVADACAQTGGRSDLEPVAIDAGLLTCSNGILYCSCPAPPRPAPQDNQVPHGLTHSNATSTYAQDNPTPHTLPAPQPLPSSQPLSFSAARRPQQSLSMAGASVDGYYSNYCDLAHIHPRESRESRSDDPANTASLKAYAQLQDDDLDDAHNDLISPHSLSSPSNAQSPLSSPHSPSSSYSPGSPATPLPPVSIPDLLEATYGSCVQEAELPPLPLNKKHRYASEGPVAGMPCAQVLVHYLVSSLIINISIYPYFQCIFQSRRHYLS